MVIYPAGSLSFLTKMGREGEALTWRCNIRSYH